MSKLTLRRKIDKKYLGSEPKNLDLSDVGCGSSKLAKLYNWYNHFYGGNNDDKYREWIIEWHEQNNPEMSDVGKLFLSEMKFISGSVAAVRRMQNNGCIFSKSVLKSVVDIERNMFNRWKDRKNNQKVEIVKKKKVSIFKDTLLFSIIEDSITRFTERWINIDPKKLILSNETKKSVEYALDNLYPIYEESKELVDGDEDLIYAFQFTKSQIKKYHEQILSLISYLDDILSSTSKEKSRKNKVQPHKLVENIKYCKKTEDFGGIESANPIKIINSKLLIVYNLKYNIISIFQSIDGFSFSGTTLKNFDKSQSKKVRKPEIFLKKFLGSNISDKINLYKSLKTKPWKENGRMNVNTLILEIR